MTERSVKVRLLGDNSDYDRALLGSAATTRAFSSELNTGTDRATNLTQAILAVTPALVPIGAVGVPMIAGLSNELGIAVLGVGTAVLAFHGMGAALKATNDYAIDPTDANLQKMRQTLATLGPAGQEFVGFLEELRPRLKALQEDAQAGLLPGLEVGIDDLLTRLPDLGRVVTTVATTLGDLGSEAGSNLADPRWDKFFTFLENEARPTLLDAGRAAGNFAEGLANLWMAFAPLETSFSSSLLNLSRDFAKWTDGLDQTQGFQEFIAYIKQNGPEVFDTLESVGNALLQIVEAAAPVGSASLPIIKAVADGVSAIADSDLGPVIIGVVSLTSAYSRLIAVSQSANTSAIGSLIGRSSYGGSLAQAKALPGALIAVESASERANTKVGALSATSERLGTSLRGAAKVAGGVGGLAFVMSDLDNKMGLTNTAMLALAGSAFGPWGAAIGGGIGLVKDFSAANGDAADKIDALTAQVNASGPLSQHDRFNFQETGDLLVNDQKSADASDRLNNALDRNAASKKAAAKAAQDQKFAEAGLGNSMDGVSNAVRAETAALIDNINTKNHAADAADNVFASETNYRQALKDAQAQARTNNVGINGSSDAALKNRQSLDQLAEAWNKVADAGGASTADMRKARASFVQVAEAMKVPKKVAQDLSRELFHLPALVKTEVLLEGVDGALTKLQSLKDRLLSTDGLTAKTFVQLKESHAGGGMVGLTRPNGLIHGPGGPTDDLIDARLSNKEFVVNAAATARYLPELYAINAQRYAGGGFVQPTGAGLGAQGGSSTMSVSLRGAKVSLDKDGFGTFVDGRIELVHASNENYAGTQRRANR